MRAVGLRADGVELVDEAGKPNPEAFQAVSKGAMSRGLLLLAGGSDGHVLRLLPQLNISDELIEEALDIFDQTFASLED